MTDAVRTPDPLLEGLPDFPYAPRYRTVGGLRLAHVDEGEGAPVVMWHGEPTWGFLWRHVLPPVRDAGHRVVLPDLAGFGRSDKPLDPGWYSYDRHVETAATLLEDLDLRDATFVVHDWGGPIGLRLAVEHPDRVARLVLTDTGLFTGEQPMSDSWHAFADFVARTEDLPVGMLVRRGCHRDPGEAVAAAYDPPFPTAPPRPGGRGRGALGRPPPQRRLEGRPPRLPGPDPAAAGRPGRRGGQARARGAALRRAAAADALGRRGPGAAAQGRRGLRPRPRTPRAPPSPRGRALPPGGPGATRRRGDRGVARVAAGLGRRRGAGAGKLQLLIE